MIHRQLFSLALRNCGCGDCDMRAETQNKNLAIAQIARQLRTQYLYA